VGSLSSLGWPWARLARRHGQPRAPANPEPRKHTHSTAARRNGRLRLAAEAEVRCPARRNRLRAFLGLQVAQKISKPAAGLNCLFSERSRKCSAQLRDPLSGSGIELRVDRPRRTPPCQRLTNKDQLHAAACMQQLWPRSPSRAGHCQPFHPLGASTRSAECLLAKQLAGLQAGTAASRSAGAAPSFLHGLSQPGH